MNEAPTIALRNTLTTLTEDADTSTRTKVADIIISDDALGTNVLSRVGPDAVLFEIDGTELFLRAGAALDYETNDTLDVTIRVDDATLGTKVEDRAALQISVTDVYEPVFELLAIQRDDNDTDFAIFGGASLDTAGRSVRFAGDVNGDGWRT